MSYIVRKAFIPLFGLIAFLIGASNANIPEEMMEVAMMLHNTCKEESGVAEEVILGARKGAFIEDNTLKCYIKCIMEQMAVIEDDGTVDEEGMIALLPDDFRAHGEKIVRACGTKHGADICDTAFLTHKCYYEQAPDKYFLP